MRLQKSFLYYPENDFVYNGFSLVHWTLPLESQKSAAFMVLFIGPPVDQNIRLVFHRISVHILESSVTSVLNLESVIGIALLMFLVLHPP